MKKTILPFILISSCFAGGINFLEKEKDIKRPGEKKEKGSIEMDLIKKLMDENKKIERLLKGKSERPIVWEKKNNIATGTVIRGIILNSIVSSNIDSPILVKVSDNEKFAGNRLTCRGTTKGKRVHVECDKLILKNKELTIKAQLLNLDGSSGLTGYYDSERDSLFTGIMVGGILSSLLSSVSQNSGILTSNKKLSPVIGSISQSANSLNEVLAEDLKSKGPKVYIDAGKKVLVYFKEALYGI